MKVVIEITPSEHFTFKFIQKNNGTRIPCPLPYSILSLIKKGLVKSGTHFPAESKIQCWLTPLGEKCSKV